MSDVFLVLSAFLASSVEMVEALTIVLAAGLTRGWRSPLIGVAAALLALGAVIASLGPALTLVPIDILRVLVGGLLLIFGLQWLRKAVLRAAGRKALHDEDAVFHQQLAAAEAAGEDRRGLVQDWYSFIVSFKSVVLEGLEVAFIVVTFGANAHDVPVAAAAALAALIVVAAAGVVIRAPMARVPENTIKFAVGVLLCAFGTFWGAEGAGVEWPGADAALLALVPLYAVAAGALVLALRPRTKVSK